MAWQALLTLAKGASLADLPEVGVEVTEETISVERAAAHGLRASMSAVEVDGHLLVIGGVDPGFDLASALAEGLQTEVVSARFISSLDYYAWTVHHADGVRTMECGEGEVVLDEGAPLPEEAGTGHLGERALLRMFEARTGLETETWLRTTARVLRRPPPPKRRRGIFRLKREGFRR